MHIFTVLRVFGKQSCLLFPSLLSGRKVAEPNKKPVDVETEVQQNQSTKAFFLLLLLEKICIQVLTILMIIGKTVSL